MEPTAAKHSPFRGALARVTLFGVVAVALRFAYVVSVRGGSCSSLDFCFFSSPSSSPAADSLSIPGGGGGASFVRASASLSPALWTTREWRRSVDFHSALFHDLVAANILSPSSKSLCLDTPAGHDVLALKEIGVADAVGIHRKKSPPLVLAGDILRQPFPNNTFDFAFAGKTIDNAKQPFDLAAEISRTLKPGGSLVIHTESAGDLYSLRSLLALFPCFRKTRLRAIGDGDALREVVLQKEQDGCAGTYPNSANSCSIGEHKLQLLQSAEPLIEEEPLKPWITLKRNIKNIKYVPSVADISFKRRYVYVDVGARSYGSSIGSWFKKQYPKQNHTFDIYAVEADKAFHGEYAARKGVNLLPFAAWVRNESLSFQVNHDPNKKSGDKGGRGMGRIRPAGDSEAADVHTIRGFDFAEWLKSAVTEKDFVVMKMDVEGTEFDLVPRLIETGAICLIDELFLECHYNRWQRCCPGERSPKYQKTYGQCMELFSSLRESGVLVHQWF